MYILDCLSRRCLQYDLKNDMDNAECLRELNSREWLTIFKMMNDIYLYEKGE